MQIYWNKRKRLHKEGVQLPQDWFGTPTWPPFHCFGTPLAAVTSCENTLLLETVRTRKIIKDLTAVRGGFLFFLSSHCSTQILTLILILVVINRSWADRHKDTGFLQNMLWHPFAHPPFCLWPLIRFGSVLWNNFRNETWYVRGVSG